MPGKGRGLYATAYIPAGEFVCEYKTSVVYSNKSTYTQYQKEYNINNEGARVVECKHDSKKYYFDATRRVNQFGVYANHSTAPNCKLYPPLFVRGKLRLSLVSIGNINARDEIVWDYGDRDPNFPWLSCKLKHFQYCTIIILIKSASTNNPPPPSPTKSPTRSQSTALSPGNYLL